MSNQLYKLTLFKSVKGLDIDVVHYIICEFIRVNIVILSRKDFVNYVTENGINKCVGSSYSKMMDFLNHNTKIIYINESRANLYVGIYSDHMVTDSWKAIKCYMETRPLDIICHHLPYYLDKVPRRTDKMVYYQPMLQWSFIGYGALISITAYLLYKLN